MQNSELRRRNTRNTTAARGNDGDHCECSGKYRSRRRLGDCAGLGGDADREEIDCPAIAAIAAFIDRERENVAPGIDGRVESDGEELDDWAALIERLQLSCQ